MSDQLPQPLDENKTATNPPHLPDESAPLDVLPLEDRPTEDVAIPSVVAVDPGDAALSPNLGEDQLPAQALRPPHPGFWFALLWCFAYLVLQVMVGIGVAIVFGIVSAIASSGGMAQSTEFDAAKLEEEARVPSLVCSSALGVLFALLVIRLVVGKQWQRRVALLRPSFTHVILAVLALPGVIYLSQASYELALFLHFPTFNYQQFLTQMFSKLPWWLGVLVVGVAPAITEELFFRGFIGRGLVARYGPVVGVLLTSLLFGLNHLDPPHIAATFAMGICLHFAYLMTRSLWVPMLMHFLNNTWGVTGMLLQDEQLDRVDDSPPPYLIAAASVLALAAAWVFYRSRARLVVPPDMGATAWKPAFPGVEAPPPETGTRIARPWPGWAPTGAVLLAFVAFAVAFLAAVG
jgi:membrane protease YdiL (CAAX protease family)